MKVYRKILFLILFISMILTGTAWADAPTTTASAQAADTLNAQRKAIEADWKKHRSQRIVVLDIDGLKASDSGNEKGSLERRLETLQNKKLSNREWKTYWAGEAQYAGELAEIYNQLVNADDSGLSALTTRLDQESQAQKAEDSRLSGQMSKAMRARSVAEAEVKAHLEGLKKSLGEMEPKLTLSTQILEQMTAELARLKTAANPIDEANLNPLRIRLEQQDARHSVLVRKSESAHAQSAVLQEVMAGDIKDLSALSKPQRVSADALIQARLDVSKIGTQLTATTTALAVAERAAHQARQLRSRIHERLPALRKGSALAHDKVKNQDVYYQAIEADINAVNDRLRGVRNMEENTEDLDPNYVCNAPLKSDQTPYGHLRECIRVIKAQLQRLDVDIEQTEQKQALTQALLNSMGQLLEAQLTDEALLKNELRISQDERSRLESLPKGSKDADWLLIWSDYAQRAESKKAKLEQAVIVSKGSQRTLAARIGVLESSMTRLNTLKDSATALLTEKDTVLKGLTAVFRSALRIAQTGWPALIYLLVAFLGLRGIRRYKARQERRALEAREGSRNDELKELEAQLSDARSQDDDDLIAELTEEITQLENRVKDESQRIETIARVAAQAATGAIYIATSLLVLDALTVDIKPILGGAAIFGLAISFGSQSLVKDVVAGFFVLIENQYAVGDVVSINGQSGTVEAITLRRTVLRDGKGGVHTITNGTVSQVTNLTQGWARVMVHYGVAYDTDITKVERVINDVGEAMYDDPKWAGKLSERPQFVGVTAFGENEITVRAWFKTRTFHNWSAEREFNLRIKTAFETAGIEIPFPQRDIRIVRELEKTLTE